MSFTITPDTDWYGKQKLKWLLPWLWQWQWWIRLINITKPAQAEEAPEETPAKSDLGGSMGVFSLILVGLLGAARRRKLH